MKSEGGATLALEPDGSILATGVNPDKDVYVIEAESPARIGAIRLEAIPHPSMPAGGSGRAPTWGNFVLTDFRVTAGESVVTWSGAYADFSQQFGSNDARKFPISLAVDADESTGWAVWPRVAQRHWAVFIPTQPMAAAGKSRLTIRLAFRSQEMLKYALGRFRLSVCTDPAERERTETRQAVLEVTDPPLKTRRRLRARRSQSSSFAILRQSTPAGRRLRGQEADPGARRAV
jgi:hypothetical protein